MATLANPKNTIAILQKYKFNIQKKYGQNFLVDPHVLEKIIAAAQISKEDFVIEIGPGIGNLTQYLCENAKEVLAVEIDRNLIPILEDTLQGYSNVTIINEDILKVDLSHILQAKKDFRSIKIAANLPYYITTPVVMYFLESGIPVESFTFMVQREVADRMQAGPGTKDYGALSLAVQYYTKPEMAASVPPNCFIPRPKVGSAVIKLTRHTQAPVDVKDEKQMFRLIRASFNQRRKTLTNGLNNASGLYFSKERVKEALNSMELPESVRGETLTLEQFARLSNLLSEK